ncbi:MAG TPA: hypothetical protein VGG77_02210 [Roseiarcus sp.]
MDSFDTCAVGVAFGFDVSVRGAASVGAGPGAVVAIGAPSGLITCEGADGAAVFGASAGCAESVEAGVGAVAIGAPSGLMICEAAGAGAGFGVSAGCAESVEVGVDGAVAIGAPSGPILCEVTSAGAWSSGAGVDAGGAESKPKGARCGASTSAFT